MANEYIDVDDFLATISATGATYLEEDAALAVEAASRAVDYACSRTRLRRFYQDEEIVTRLFTPRLSESLEIFDLSELDSIYVTSEDGGLSYLEASEFKLLPLNAEIDGEPWTHVLISTRCPSGVGSVGIGGKWGWAAVPPAIMEATSLVASRLLKRKREAPFGVVGFGIDQAAAISIARTDPDVTGLLRPFNRDFTFRSVSIG